jgi:hypothetical protein
MEDAHSNSSARGILRALLQTQRIGRQQGRVKSVRLKMEQGAEGRAKFFLKEEGLRLEGSGRGNA